MTTRTRPIALRAVNHADALRPIIRPTSSFGRMACAHRDPETPAVDRRRCAGRGGAVLLGRAELELLQRRARRLGAKTVQEGLGVQDLGGRAGDGLAARRSAREVLLHHPR